MESTTAKINKQLQLRKIAWQALNINIFLQQLEESKLKR